METRVSVVIPCFHAAPFLRQTIESALNQSHAPCEILVVDDGSTDASPAIARSYGLPVRVISQVNMEEQAWDFYREVSATSAFGPATSR